MRPTKAKSQGGFTLVEVMVASVILTVVALSLAGVMGNLGKVVTTTREMTLASHLGQEKVESLKSLSFYQIMVTSDSVLDTNFSPPIPYDNGYYPPEIITNSGITLYRRVFVEKVDTPSGQVANMGYPHPDTGLKRLNVYVSWQARDRSWKKITVSGLTSNPSREALDRRIYGTVRNSVTGNPVAGALVQARRNPGWGAVTDNTGYYSFQATDDTMILISNKYAYFEYTSNQFNLNYGDNLQDFTMVAIASRTVTGYVYTDAGVVISQINNKWHATNDGEFIELYNGSAASVNLSAYTLTFVDKFDVQTVIPMTLINSSIPANGYFLYLGSQFGTDTVAPDGKLANAYFTSLMNHAQQGGVILKDGSGTVIDRLAWGNALNPPPAAATEGTGIDLGGGSAGIGQGNTLVRKVISTSTIAALTPPAGAHVNFGNAWDSQNNNNDFVLIATANPRNMWNIKVPQGGRALGGAVVNADDGVSGSTAAASNGFFTLTMATGSWTISAASTTAMGTKDINVTAAASSFAMVLATAPCTKGFITGTVRQFGTSPFAGVLVQADPGGIQGYSDSQGVYWLAVPADDEYFVTGNPDFFDPDWNTAVTPAAIPVTAGSIADTVDLNIWKNAYVSGRVTTNGVDGLPGVAVVASGQFSNGNTAMTDGGGYYTISGLRLVGNPYDIYPVVVEGQSNTPTRYTVTLVQGQNTTNQDFQISGAFVTISGTATLSGQPITSGVHILASTVTISASSPPDITFALRNGSVKYYQALTDSAGSYSMSVVGGATYNLVAWYTTTSSTTAKAISVTVPTNVGNNNSHFSFP